MARNDRLVRQHLRTRFIVTTKSGMTWEGVLIDADATSLLLLEASAVSPDGTRTAADGQVYLPRVDVAYMQKT